MISICILGKYREDDLIYALNSVVNQDYSDIELIITMNELEMPTCAVINSLNGNRRKNLKNVLINRCEKLSRQEHMDYISKHMNGDWLLCLWDGGALYSKDCLSKCIEKCNKDDFVIGINALYKDTENYVGNQKGGFIFPATYAKSNYFKQLNLDKAIELQTRRYVKNEGLNLRYCNVPLIKSYVNLRVISNKEYSKKVLAENVDKWSTQVKTASIQLNFSGYIEISRYLTSYFTTKGYKRTEKLLKWIDDKLEYIIMKQKGGLWEIKDSDKALICHLWEVKKYCAKLHKKYLIKEYLEKVNHSSQKKAVLVVSEFYLWHSCYKSVYDELLERNYKVDIVYVPFEHNTIKVDIEESLSEWRNSGYLIQIGKNYNISSNNPDIIFFCKPYDVVDEKWCIKEIEKVIDKIVYIPYCMATMRVDEEIRRLMFQLPMHYIAWKQVVYSKVYSDMIDRYSYNANNKLLIGHPKYDITIKDFSQDEKNLYDTIIENAGGNTIILWNSHFAIGETGDEEIGTFLNMGMRFLELIANTDEKMYVIWRPHPMFWKVISQFTLCEKMDMYINIAVKKKKLYVDKGSSQWPAIFAADILVSDPSSLIESWIIYNKPVILTTNNKKKMPMDNVIYHATTLEELKVAIFSVINKDIFLDLRRKLLFASRK